MIIFRNDDVSSGTNLNELKRFSELFDKYNFDLVQGITLYGGVIPVDHTWDNDTIDYKCTDSFEDNKEVVQYLKARNDKIGIHGIKHYHYMDLPIYMAEAGILCAKKKLGEIFDREVSYFIPPFNEISDELREFCKKNGLEVLADEGEHLELLLDKKDPPIADHFRCHYWRFFKVYPNGLERLDKLLSRIRSKI